MDAAPACGTLVSGYVLAGGRSSRMGLDKSRLPWQGRMLIEAVASEVALAAGCVGIVGGEPVGDLRYVKDPLAGFGPVAGIIAALRDSQRPWSLVVACDMPGVRADFLRTLIGSAAGDAVVPVTPDGRMHPLCAVWSARVLEHFERAMQAGEHTIRRVAANLRCVLPCVAEAALLRNVNTPEEYSEALATAGE